MPARLEWVRTAILLAVGGYLFSIPAGLVVDPDPMQALGEVGALVLLGAAFFLAVRGALRVAGLLTVLAIWGEIHAGVFFAGSMVGTGVTVLPVLVAGTAILLGGRTALGLALTCSLSLPLFTLTGRAALGIEPLVEGGDIRAALILPVILVAIALLMAYVLRYLGEVLDASRRNERRFSDLVVGNPDGILSLDGEGRVEDLNPAAACLLGVSRKEAVGRGLDELPLGSGRRLLGTQPVEGLEGDSLPVQLDLARRDGTEVFLEVVRKPLTRTDGSPGMMLILRDLTVRREVEARAVQLGRIVEEARNEIFVLDRESLGILVANRGARENLGYTKTEILGLTMFQIQPTLTPEVGRLLSARLYERGEEVVTATTVHHRKDGSPYPVEMRYQRGRLEGRPAILAFGMDITGRERAEKEQDLLQAQLLHAQKMEAVGLLAGGVAHDFNNLLTVIGGCSEILLEIGDPEVRELTREILDAQERGAALTQQLLAFARREIVQAEDLSLSEVFRGLDILIRRILTERVRLVLEVEEGLTIRADRGQLEQVMLNLAANARDAMEGMGTLTIRARESDGEAGEGEGPGFVSIGVEDSGHGMDPQTVERVFEPFFTTKARGKGTGLGLSTVHGIVSQNGGRISLESRVGEGTAIEILWPLVPPEEEEEEGKEKDIPPATRGTVLVAEDEEGARSLIRTVLEREGYMVLVAEDGAGALELAQDLSQPVDLLLTDIVMPGMSGLELAEKIRAQRPGLPILFMSGYVDTHLAGSDGGSPALNLLAKPFRPAELRRRVREILEPESHISSS